MMIHTCQQCQKTFKRSNKTAKYCSKLCYGVSIRKGEDRECPVCHATFHVPRWRLALGKGIYCSKSCYGVSMRTGEKRECPACGDVFYHQRWRGGGEYCSPWCEKESAKAAGGIDKNTLIMV